MRWIRFLDGLEQLAEADPDLQQLLKGCEFPTLVQEVKRAVEWENWVAAKMVAGELKDLFSDIQQLVAEKGIPYTYNACEANLMEWVNQNEIPPPEIAYKLVGWAVAEVAIGLTTKARININRLAREQSFEPGDEVVAAQDIFARDLATEEVLYLAVREGQSGVVEEFNESGPEGHWLHVTWEDGERHYPHNAYPSQVRPLVKN